MADVCRRRHLDKTDGMAVLENGRKVRVDAVSAPVHVDDGESPISFDTISPFALWLFNSGVSVQDMVYIRIQALHAI